MSRDLQTGNGQNKLALWAERVSSCRNSGLRVKDWCRENGVNEQTYYKWQKKLFTMAQTQQESRFAEVTPVRTSGNIAVTVESQERKRIFTAARTQLPWKRYCGYESHAERLHRHRPGVHRLRLHRPSPWDRRSGCPGSAARPIQQLPVSVLWQAPGSDQGTVLGGQRFRAALQASGIRQLPVAAKGKRGKKPDAAAIPLAHGGLER